MKFFDVKLYEPRTEGKVKHTLEEMETVRGLTETQKISLVSYLERNKIRYLAKEVEAKPEIEILHRGPYTKARFVRQRARFPHENGKEDP